MNQDDTMISHQARYDNWAPDYNKDVAARHYDGPQYLVDYLLETADSGTIAVDPNEPSFKVLDVGCGSGLVGTQLREKGFQHIDGTDLSQGMIAEAHRSGAYQTLMAWINLNEPLPFFLQGQYNLTICCGVFALDFVEPKSLRYLVQTTQPGGTIIMTTKSTYYDTYDFEGYYQRLVDAGKLVLVDCRKNKPYLGKEADGHYWIFTVPTQQEPIV